MKTCWKQGRVRFSGNACFRPHDESEDVERLYFVGAGTHPGAGMPGVLSTARVLDTVVPEPGHFRQRSQ